MLGSIFKEAKVLKSYKNEILKNFISSIHYIFMKFLFIFQKTKKLVQTGKQPLLSPPTLTTYIYATCI